MRNSGSDQRRLAKYMPLEREADCLARMQAAIDNIPGAYAVVLSSIDGQRLAQAAMRDINASRLAAIIGSFCGLGDTLGKELGQSDLRDVMVQTATGIAVVQRIPHTRHRMVLMTAANSEANLGLVSSMTRYCAEEVAGLCFLSGGA